MDKEKCRQLILSLRKEKQLSPKELAEALHVTPPSVCNWEQGASLPDVCIIEHLADFLVFPVMISTTRKIP